MLRFCFVFLFCFFSAFASFAADTVSIDKDCITVSDMYPGSGVSDSLLCNLQYGQEKLITKLMAVYIIKKYSLTGVEPKDVLFKRSGVQLTEDRLKQDIQNQLSLMYPDTDLEISSIRLGKDVYVPESMVYSIDIPQNRFGSMVVSISNGTKKYSASIYLSAYKNLYVATGAIKRGDDIEGSVTTQRTDMTRFHGNPITETKGYIAKMNIPSGRVVTDSMVEAKPDALKDAEVSVIYTNGALKINSTGTLLENGFDGQQVSVEMSGSKTVIRGIYHKGLTVTVTP